MASLTDEQWQELKNSTKELQRKNSLADEIEATQQSVEIQTLLGQNETARAFFLSVAGPAQHLLSKLATIEPLDRSRGGPALVENIKQVASELRFMVNNAIHGNYDAVIKRVDTVSAERLRNLSIETFAQTIRREVENNRNLIHRVEELTEQLEGFIAKYFERIQAGRPMYNGTQTAQQGTASASGGDDQLHVLSNAKR